jgi:hypothetical protein
MATLVNTGDVYVSYAEVRNSSLFYVTPDTITVSVYGYGYHPQASTTTSDDALVDAATPTALTSVGRYSYSYTIPDDMPSGDIYVWWEATIGDSVWRYLETLTVVNNNDDSQPTTDTLLSNTLYMLTLKNVESVDGDTIDVDYYFTSSYDPYCTTYRNIFGRLSSYIKNVKEDTINYLIWQYCVEADNISLHCYDTDKQQPYFINAKRKFVEAAVIVNMLQTLSIGTASNNLKRKKLGDLEVEYNVSPQTLQNVLNNHIKEMEEWEQVLNSCGVLSAGASHGMIAAIPSIHHPDRADHGRRIRKVYGSHVAANTKVLEPGHIKTDASFSRGRTVRKIGDHRYDF